MIVNREDMESLYQQILVIINTVPEPQLAASKIVLLFADEMKAIRDQLADG